jgi:outer membrane protein OmpA-like peptidoglycan-associated protein
MIDAADRIQLEQVFVVGRGAIHSVVSNAPPAGKTRNRRVEMSSIRRAISSAPIAWYAND